MVVKSWTRTLNLDDAHTLLSMTEPGMDQKTWVEICHKQMPRLSAARRREVIRLLRDGFLEWTDDDCVRDGLFLKVYASSPAAAQVDLVAHQWAMSHEITLVAATELIGPALESGEVDIPLAAVEALVARHVDTRSAESLRKTRTVLLGALEGIGTLVTRGTGQHRSLRAARGTPHPLAFGYLVLRELEDRGIDAMMSSEVPESSVAARLTQCGRAHAEECVQWVLESGMLAEGDDEIGAVRDTGAQGAQ
jgi:hypothetical protein